MSTATATREGRAVVRAGLPCRLAAAFLGAAALSAGAPADVRVGLVAFQDFGSQWAYYRDLFTAAARERPDAFRFRLAAGTYGDVLHWLNQGHFDMAVLSPGVAAACLSPLPEPGAPAPCLHLATRAMPPARSTFAPADRRRPGRYERYGAICVVGADSAVRDAPGLAAALREGRTQVLFVEPLSVSGHLAPLFALRTMLGPGELNAVLRRAVFTASHSNSVRLLCDPEHGRSCSGSGWLPSPEASLPGSHGACWADATSCTISGCGVVSV